MQRKKVIVTGCRGQLGIAVNKLYAGSQELELVNTDVEELDITNIDKVMEFVRAVKPYAIINCARIPMSMPVKRMWTMHTKLMPSVRAT